MKTGQLQSMRRDPRVAAFVAAGAVGLLLAPLLAVPYAVLTFLLGVRYTRLPLHWWPIIPVAFAMHHLTYWLGIVTGITSSRK